MKWYRSISIRWETTVFMFADLFITIFVPSNCDEALEMHLQRFFSSFLAPLLFPGHEYVKSFDEYPKNVFERPSTSVSWHKPWQNCVLTDGKEKSTQ